MDFLPGPSGGTSFNLEVAMKTQICLSITILFLCATAYADDPLDIVGLEKRVDTLETRQDVTEKDVETLKDLVSGLTGNPVEKCPCDKGGKCICGDNCKCELCLEHLSNIDVVNLYAKHEEEISKIWENLPEEKTMRDAVKIWITQQHAKNNGVESAGEALKDSGVRVLFFTADWCAPCQAAKRRLGDMIEQLEVIDCTDGNPCPEYGEIRYPTALKIVNGKVVTRCEGEHVGRLIIGGWLEALPAGGELNREQKTDSPPAVFEDSRIERPSRFSYQMPVMYRPRYYYTPPTFSQRFFGSSCPNCR
jgi:thiol-disulfide isomerase/thioredoxin